MADTLHLTWVIPDSVRKHLNFMPAVKAGLVAAGLFVKGKVSEYPAVSRRPQPFKSLRQQRYFFWALKTGQILVPYFRGVNPRSETLGRRWTERVENDGLAVIIGNNASYAKLVQDRESQSFYHKETGWRTVQDVVAREGEEARKLVADAVIEHIRRS